MSTDVGNFFNLNIAPTASKYTNSGIYQSIETGHIHQFHRCIEYGESVHLRDEDTGNNFFGLIVQSAELASQLQFVPFIHQLAVSGLNPNHQNYNGETPLELAINKGLDKLVIAFLRCGAELNDSDRLERLPASCKKHTPSLRQAILREDYFMVRERVLMWHRINLKYDGCSLLESARKQFGRQHIIYDLLQTHFNTVECAHAVIAGNLKHVRFLMENQRCDLQAVDKSEDDRNFHDTANLYKHAHLLPFLPQRSSNKGDKSTTQSVACMIM